MLIKCDYCGCGVQLSLSEAKAAGWILEAKAEWFIWDRPCNFCSADCATAELGWTTLQDEIEALDALDAKYD